MVDLPFFSVCQSSTAPRTFEEDIATYTRAGVQGIEVLEDKLSRDRGQALEQMAMLADSGLKVTSVQTRVQTPLPNVATRPEDLWDPDQRMAAFSQSIEFFAEACPGEELVFVSPGGAAENSNYCEAHQVARRCYRELADRCADLGTRLCVEPLAAVFMNQFGFICTLDEGMAVVHDVDRPNFGLALDVFHVWREHLLADRLSRLGDQIFAVHICDWPKSEPRCREDRVLPGDGLIDLPTIFGALDRSTYGGAYCLEIFSDEALPDSLWTMDPVAMIRRGRAGFAAAWSRRR